MAMNVEAEIRDLKRRVGELEGSFGFLTRQIQGVHKDLIALHGRVDQFEKRTEQRFDRVENDIRQVRSDLQGLRKDIPKIVGDTMREVMGKSRKNGRKAT